MGNAGAQGANLSGEMDVPRPQVNLPFASVSSSVKSDGYPGDPRSCLVDKFASFMLVDYNAWADMFGMIVIGTAFPAELALGLWLLVKRISFTEPKHGVNPGTPHAEALVGSCTMKAA